jgi:hypothetical protein
VLRGKRLIGKAPHGRWRTLTFIGALRVDRIDAPCVFDGPINGESFLAYIEQVLIPTLRRDDIVVIDNLGSHESKAVRTAIRSADAKLKAALRKAQARTLDAVCRQVAKALPSFSAPECANYFRHAGYAQCEMIML